MTTPYRIPDIPDALPLCRQLARQKGRFLFADRLRMLAPPHYREEARLCAVGMLDSYLEMRVITRDQYKAMRDELMAFVYGASA